MKKRVIVLSLGGSQIIPNEINYPYLKEFKKELLMLSKKFKFVVVCGGGNIARKYINALNRENISEKFQGYSGISATRSNARFMNYFFNIDPSIGIPETMDTLEKYITKKDIIFCGALSYKANRTSDTTAAEVASHFKTIFINITNVKGLYDKNPIEHKDAKMISEISWKDFYVVAKKIGFKPGQHFALDVTAAKIIKKNKIPTYIIGKNVKHIGNIINGKKFSGTIIVG